MSVHDRVGIVTGDAALPYNIGQDQLMTAQIIIQIV